MIALIEVDHLDWATWSFFLVFLRERSLLSMTSLTSCEVRSQFCWLSRHELCSSPCRVGCPWRWKRHRVLLLGARIYRLNRLLDLSLRRSGLDWLQAMRLQGESKVLESFDGIELRHSLVIFRIHLLLFQCISTLWNSQNSLMARLWLRQLSLRSYKLHNPKLKGKRHVCCPISKSSHMCR